MGAREGVVVSGGIGRGAVSEDSIGRVLDVWGVLEL